MSLAIACVIYNLGVDPGFKYAHIHYKWAGIPMTSSPKLCSNGRCIGWTNTPKTALDLWWICHLLLHVHSGNLRFWRVVVCNVMEQFKSWPKETICSIFHQSDIRALHSCSWKTALSVEFKKWGNVHKFSTWAQADPSWCLRQSYTLLIFLSLLMADLRHNVVAVNEWILKGRLHWQSQCLSAVPHLDPPQIGEKAGIYDEQQICSNIYQAEDSEQWKQTST